MPELTPISDLTAASTLTGDELVPVVQDGTTVRTTLQGIAELASDVDAVAFPYVPIHFMCGSFTTAITPIPSGVTGPNSSGSSTSEQPDTPPTTLYGAMNRVSYATTAATGQTAGLALAGTSGGVFRALSGNAAWAGFRFEMLFVWRTVGAAQRAWAGLIGTVTAASGDPSAIVNCLMFAKDEADTNLQLMHNDGSGACTKVDTAIAFSAVTNKLLRMRIEVTPGDGNPLMTLEDLETGTVLYTYTPTTNLPAADQALWWHVLANTAASAVSAIVKFIRASYYVRFGSFGA